MYPPKYPKMVIPGRRKQTHLRKDFWHCDCDSQKVPKTRTSHLSNILCENIEWFSKNRLT